MQKHHFIINGSRVEYLSIGKGSRLLIGFHGFGERSVVFAYLEDFLAKNDYTLIAFDLPFHGHTHWQRTNFTPEDFEQMIKQVLAFYPSNQKFDLIGNSFGAKVVRSLVFDFQEKIEKIILLAPDGFGTKGLRFINYFPNGLKRFLMFLVGEKPIWLLRLTAGLYRRKWVTKSLHDFVFNHIGKHGRQSRTLAYWLSVSYFNHSNKDFKACIKKNSISTHILIGEKDEIVPIKSLLAFANNNPFIHLTTIPEKGHQLLSNKLNAYLLNL